MESELRLIQFSYHTEPGPSEEEVFVRLGNHRKLVFSRDEQREFAGLTFELKGNSHPVLAFGVTLFLDGRQSVNISALDNTDPIENTTRVLIVREYDSEGELVPNFNTHGSSSHTDALDQRSEAKRQGCFEDNQFPQKIDIEETVREFLKLVRGHEVKRLSQAPVKTLLQPMKST